MPVRRAFLVWCAVALACAAAHAADAPGAPPRESFRFQPDKIELRHSVDILPAEGGVRESGTLVQGEYVVPWDQNGWAVMIGDRPVLLGEDFRVVEKVTGHDPDTLLSATHEEVLDKSDPRLMQVSARAGRIVSRLVYVTSRRGVGQMRREVGLGASGVSMRWTYRSESDTGGVGRVSILLPQKSIAERGLVMVSDAGVGDAGDEVPMTFEGGEPPAELARGLTASRMMIDHGPFRSQWRWGGDVARARVIRGDAGLALQLPIECKPGETVAVTLQLTHDVPLVASAAGWEATLAGKRLSVSRDGVRIIASDAARVQSGRRTVDLTTVRRPRPPSREQGDRTASLEVQTATRDLGWLKRQVFLGPSGARLRYAGALTDANARGRLILQLATPPPGASIDIQYRDGRAETVQTPLPDDWERGQLLAIELPVGAERVSVSFADASDGPLPWRLQSAAGAGLRLTTEYTQQNRIDGEVIVRASSGARKP